MKTLQHFCFIAAAVALFAGASFAQMANSNANTKVEVLVKGESRIIRMTDANGVVTERPAPAEYAKTSAPTTAPTQPSESAVQPAGPRSVITSSVTTHVVRPQESQAQTQSVHQPTMMTPSSPAAAPKSIEAKAVQVPAPMILMPTETK